MRKLDLHSAVNEIVQATLDDRTPGEAFPFFFIVGAGISWPPIPLAAEIERQCRARIAEHNDPSPPMDAPALDRYALCFERAFPQAEHRRRFIHNMVHRKQISAANLRLAHLLGAGKLTKLVFTPNFDEMLSRALRLFGHDIVVCDHPKTSQRIDLRRHDLLQIIHVHGTHWFYDCCNLRDEIEGQARSDPRDAVSMGQLLDRALAERSPVVVGYSGWEGDVLMSALLRRLRLATLPFNLYWFCHSLSDADQLPAEIREHTSVRLVLPPFTSSSSPSPVTGLSLSADLDQLDLGSSGDHAESEGRLLARDVFEAFIQNLALDPPLLTSDPLRFFLSHLQENLNPSVASGKAFLIGQVLRRIRVGMELEASQFETLSKTERLVSEHLGSLASALWRSDYPESVRVMRQIDTAQLDDTQRFEFAAALESLSYKLWRSDPKLGEEVCEVWSELAIATLSNTGDPQHWSISAAKALTRKGHILRVMGQRSAAAGAYAEAVRRFGDAPEANIREEVAFAQWGIGNSLALEQPDTAAAAYLEVVRRFGDVQEPPTVRRAVCLAFVGLSQLHYKAGRIADAVAALTQVVSLLDQAPEPSLRPLLADALLRRGDVLQGADPGAAFNAYEVAIQRLAGAPDADSRIWLARALFRQGFVLSLSGNSEAALATYAEVIRRFGDSAIPELRQHTAEARLRTGYLLQGLERVEEADQVFLEIERTLSDAIEPDLRVLAAQAIAGHGQLLLQAGSPSDALHTLSQLIERFGGASEVRARPVVASALLEQASILTDIGDLDAATKAYSLLIQRFDENPDPAWEVLVAQVLVKQGTLLAIAGRVDPALRSFVQVVERFGDSLNPMLQLEVAWAQLYRSVALSDFGDTDAALVDCAQLLQRFGGVPDSRLREPVARALRHKGVLLAKAGDYDAALGSLAEVVNRFGDCLELPLRATVAQAMLDQGVVLSLANQPRLAVEAFERVVQGFGDTDEEPIINCVAEALCDQGIVLADSGDQEKAIQCFARLVRRYGNPPAPGLRQVVARALAGHGDALTATGRPEAGAELYAEFLRRFGDAVEPEICELLAEVRQSLAASPQLPPT